VPAPGLTGKGVAGTSPVAILLSTICEVMMRVVHAAIGLIAISVFATTTIGAQKPVTQGAAISETFVIDAIDYANRLVTLRDSSGVSQTIECGPGVERFNALKVGDKVTFRYYESVVYAIRKPGATDKPAENFGVVRTPGAAPGGTISKQMNAVVTINAIDLKVPSVTVTSADGRKMSFKLENPKNAEGVKPGDKVEITYTQALAVSVEPAK
jgi:Cu/Ag efflux protein CusF